MASAGTATSRDANHGVQFSESGTVTNSQSRGEHATQDEGISRESTKTHVDGYSNTSEASLRQDRSSGERTSRSISDSIDRHRDLLADSSFLAQVAQRNNMSEARFYNQDDIDVFRMVEQYASEKYMFQTASSLPQQGLSGATMAATPAALQEQHIKDGTQISNNVKSAVAANHRAVGVSNKADQRLPVTVALPLEMATQAKTEVGHEIESSKAETAPFVRNIQIWTNEGQALGTGPVVTSIVVDDAVANSVESSISNATRMFTGKPPNFKGKPLLDEEQKQTAPPISSTKN